MQAFAWETILESNRLSKIVLEKEAELSEKFRKDKQYGYDIRLNNTVRTQTREYAEAFQRELDGMVERRMQESIHALGSLWLTAWINAGQPSLGDSLPIRWTHDDLKEMEKFNKSYQTGHAIGRDCK